MKSLQALLYFCPGMQLHYKKYGEKGEILIILHGFLGSLDNWHTLATAFGVHFCVYVVDQRNHGRSPHSHEHSVDLMVDDLLKFMNHHKIDKAHLLGHSMGGKVVMQFAFDHPQRVQKLMVVDIAPRSYGRGHDEVFMALRAVSLDKVSSRRHAEEMMQPLMGDTATRQFLMKNLERSDTGGYRWKMNLDVLQKDYDGITQAIHWQHPFSNHVLFIKGGVSAYIRPADWDDIQQMFTNARLHIIEQAGHWVHADKPEEFYELVLTFLR